MSVPTNLIPTKITGLPEYTGSSTLGYLPYILDGQTFKVQFANIAAVGAVPSTRVIASGTGLAGGGDLSADRVISIAAGGVGVNQLSLTGVTAGTYGSGSDVPVLTVDATGRVTSVTTAALSVTGFVPTSRTITAGNGLTGGGSLASDITLSASFSATTPLALGIASPGVAITLSRGDHVHPALDLSDTNQTQGALPLGRGGTGDALSPVAGAVVYSTGTKFAVSTAGAPGQILVSNGTAAPSWTNVGAGTVTSVAVATANGLAGTVANPTVSPVITLSTTVTGVVKGDGTTLSAATAGTDYVAPGAYTASGLTMATARLLGRTTASIGAAQELTVGTGLTLVSGSLVNAAPDQVVSLTGAGTTTITGTYPSFTITSNDSTAGTVTSVNASGGTTGLSFTGGPVTSAGTLTLNGTLAVANGGTGAIDAPTALTNLGAYPASNPSGFTSNVGTVTSVSGTGTVSGLSLSGTVTSAGSLTLGGTLAVLPSNFASQTANTVLAAPNGSAGVPTFRAIVAADVPTLNQNTTGTASNVTGIVAVINGGTGQSSYTDGQLLIGNTTGNTLTKTTLTAGTNVTITNGSGAITINAADQFVGTVTSVGQTFTGGLISVAGSPITTSGTLALTVAGTSGGIPYFSSGTTWATSAALAANAIVVGGGAGLAPATVTTGTGVVTALGVNVGTAGSFIVNGGALGTPSSGTVTNLTGTASININGTVGATTPTTGAFTSVSLTAGSVLAWNSDVGLSRSAAATLNLGDGTAGTSSGTLVLAKTNFAGNANITSPSLGNLQVGTGGTTGAGGSLSLTGMTASGAISANSLTLTTALSVGNGGTGATTLTSGYLLKGNGTSAVSASVVYDTGTNVGIGTASPTSKLDIATGDLRFSGTGQRILGDMSNGTFTNRLLFQTTTANGNTNVHAVPNGTSTVAGFKAETDPTFVSGSVLTMDIVGGSWAQISSSIRGTGTYLPIIFKTSELERARISVAGGFSVGTTTDPGAGNIGLAAGKLLQYSSTAYITPEDNVAGARIVTPGVFNLATGGTAVRMTVDASGNVGIGASPSARLSVNGGSGTSQTRFEVSTTEVQEVATNAAQSAYANRLTDAAQHIWKVTGSERMRIDSSGNVGIGTSSPATKLDVLGASSDQIRVRTAGTEFYRFGRNSSTGYMDFYGSQTGYTGYTFGGVDGERMRIDSSGNVGINTTTPGSYKLNVQGTTYSTAYAVSSSEHLIYGSDANTIGLRIGLTGPYYGIGTTGSNNMRINSASGGDMLFAIGATEFMRIANTTGNVGIGTSSPQSKMEIRATSGGSVFNALTLSNYVGASVGTGVALHFDPNGAGTLARAASIQSVQATSGNYADLRFFTANSDTPAERIRITPGGDVGIGTSSPGYPFVVVANSSTQAVRIAGRAADGIATLEFTSNNQGTTQAYIQAGATFLFFGTSTVERMRIDGSGNVGIGTSSPGAKLDVSGNIRLSAGTPNIEFNNGGGMIYGPAGNTLAFATGGGPSAPQEKMRIDSSGNLLVGATAYSSTLAQGAAISGNSATAMFIGHANGTGSGATYVGFVYNSTTIGSITQSGTTAVLYNTTSDVRLKKNIADADNASSLIDALQVRKFDWKAGGEHQRYGFIAQELVTVAPEAVSQPEDPDEMMGVDYSKLVPMLIKEVQSLRARVAQLEGN